MTWLEALRELGVRFARPPVWGESDCCQLASEYVRLITGVDHASKFSYDSKTGALRTLAEHGGLVGLISSCIGQPHEGATEGDLVVCDIGSEDELPTTGIYNGQYVFVMHPDYGLSRADAKCIRKAWTICQP